MRSEKFALSFFSRTMLLVVRRKLVLIISRSLMGSCLIFLGNLIVRGNIFIESRMKVILGLHLVLLGLIRTLNLMIRLGLKRILLITLLLRLRLYVRIFRSCPRAVILLPKSRFLCRLDFIIILFEINSDSLWFFVLTIFFVFILSCFFVYIFPSLMLLILLNDIQAWRTRSFRLYLFGHSLTERLHFWIRRDVLLLGSGLIFPLCSLLRIHVFLIISNFYSFKIWNNHLLVMELHLTLFCLSFSKRNGLINHSGLHRNFERLVLSVQFLKIINLIFLDFILTD